MSYSSDGASYFQMHEGILAKRVFDFVYKNSIIITNITFVSLHISIFASMLILQSQI